MELQRNLAIVWDKRMPPELRLIAETYLKRYAMLLPGWMQTLHIEYESADRNRQTVGEESREGPAALAMGTAVEYRHSALYVHSTWLEMDDLQRERCWIHEIVHSYLSAFERFSEDLIDKCSEHDQTKSVMWEMLGRERQKHLEACTQDLAFMIHGLLSERKTGAVI